MRPAAVMLVSQFRDRGPFSAARGCPPVTAIDDEDYFAMQGSRRGLDAKVVGGIVPVLGEGGGLPAQGFVQPTADDLQVWCDIDGLRVPEVVCGEKSFDEAVKRGRGRCRDLGSDRVKTMPEWLSPEGWSVNAHAAIRWVPIIHPCWSECGRDSRHAQGQRGEDRAVGPVERGRVLVRRSTAASCRRTSSSASLAAEDRPSRISHPQTRTKMR